MAFALAVTHLIETLRQPGCPVCALQRAAARKAVDLFLWENLMDPEIRARTVQAGGFCPPHTRLLAIAELANTGRPLGVNILYETLARTTANGLRAWRPAWPSGWLTRLLSRSDARTNPPCPLCAAEDAAALNTLTTLFEELERPDSEMQTAYTASDGLCRAHLARGLAEAGPAYPRAAGWLASQTANLLEIQADHMREMIRKQNWEYREEKLTPAEVSAWQRVLTFFTGYPAERFTFKREDDPPN